MPFHCNPTSGILTGNALNCTKVKSAPMPDQSLSRLLWARFSFGTRQGGTDGVDGASTSRSSNYITPTASMSSGARSTAAQPVLLVRALTLILFAAALLWYHRQPARRKSYHIHLADSVCQLPSSLSFSLVHCVTTQLCLDLNFFTKADDIGYAYTFNCMSIRARV